MMPKEPAARARSITVVAALMTAAFTFNTTENLPIGLIASDLQVADPSVGHLVTGYGLTVAAASLPPAHLTKDVPRRYVLTAVLGALVLASWASASVASYGLLLAARVVTALGQALFWAVMGPVAVGLFSPAVRGRGQGPGTCAGQGRVRSRDAAATTASTW